MGTTKGSRFLLLISTRDFDAFCRPCLFSPPASLVSLHQQPGNRSRCASSWPPFPSYINQGLMPSFCPFSILVYINLAPWQPPHFYPGTRPKRKKTPKNRFFFFSSGRLLGPSSSSPCQAGIAWRRR